ncbi:MAG: hypothetical protein H6687_02140 [Bacillales bacterium]|nr:hypothetical protein [Bacillales bacterium]
MSGDEEQYKANKEMIQSLSEECIYYRNINDIEKGKESIMELCSIYRRIGYLDLEAKTLYWLASFYKNRQEFAEFEKILDQVSSLYKRAILESEDQKLYADNNAFLLDLSADYISIGAYSKAFDTAIYSIKVYSVGFNLKRSIATLYEIEKLRNDDLDNYLFLSYDKSKVNSIKSAVMAGKISTSLRDPIEDTDNYRKISLEIEKEIVDKIKEEDNEINYHKYFDMKKDILEREFGIKWSSPEELKKK